MAGFKFDNFFFYPRPKSRCADFSLLPRYEASKMYGFPHQHQYQKKIEKSLKNNKGSSLNKALKTDSSVLLCLLLISNMIDPTVG